MQSVVYNTPLYHLLFVSVLYSMYIIIKLLSYYYYLIIIFFPHERRGLHGPILVPNKPNIIIIMIYNLYTIINYIAIHTKYVKFELVNRNHKETGPYSIFSN